jgi:predicted nucleic acid-binding protein
MPAVSNTSPIFNLACIGRLELLRQQFGQVWIPPSVESELGDVPDAETLRLIREAQAAGWLLNRPTREADLVRLLTVDLHSGEAEAIALALQTKADWLLIDEKERRTMARRLGLRITGVLGVLLHAKRTGQIDQIKPAVLALRERARFFISSELEVEILRRAGE